MKDDGMKIMPFRPDMEAAVLAGTKTMTTRSKPYGKRGHVLELATKPVRYILLTKVWKEYLGEVARLYYKKEGFDSFQAFQLAWCEIHPNKGWTPEKWVFCHEFTLMDSNYDSTLTKP